MPKVYKISGQAAPAADTDTVLYTVPALTSFVQSTLSICNRDKTGLIAEFRVAVVPSGESLSNKHYLRYDELIDFRASKTMTLGFTLATGDKVYVRASSPNLSFSLFGAELS